MNAMDEGRFVAQTTNLNQKVKTSMNPEGFEPEISESKGSRSMS
jgi:hypothetical protein